MIPLSSAGVQPRGHPLRVVNNGSGNPDVPHVVAHSEVDVERSMPVSQPQFRPQPAVIDLTTSTRETQDKEPPAKRQRLEMPPGVSSGAASPAPSVGSGSGGELRSASGVPMTPKPPSTTWRGRPAWSFQSLLSDTPGVGDSYGENAVALAQGGKPASPPPMPVPPWKHVSQEPSGSNRTSDSLPVKKVETTPYRIETPSIAPEIKDDSELRPVFYHENFERECVANGELSLLQKLQISGHGLEITRKMSSTNRRQSKDITTIPKSLRTSPIRRVRPCMRN